MNICKLCALYGLLLSKAAKIGFQFRRLFRVLLCFCLLTGLTLPAYGIDKINLNAVITYSYDDLNRLQAVTRSDGPAIAFNYDEVGNFTTQGVSNSPDTDGDQIANFADLDEDGDGMPDAWENQYGFNPLDPSDAAQDANGNGISNLQEYLNGTNPLPATPTSTSVPAVPDLGLLIMALALGLISASQTKKRGV
jgi:YD repeat-containing protein